MIEGLRSDSYQEMLNKTGLISLEMRRLRADLIEVFKILHGLEGLSHEYFFQIHHESKTRGHPFKLNKNRFALDCRKYFFSQRVVDEWNALPEKAVTSTTVNQFKKEIAPLFGLQRSNFISRGWLSAPVLRSNTRE